jgi:acyl carrier protein
MNEARDRLQQIFRKVFGDATIELRDEMTAADIDGWDSLAHINLIIAVEREFKIKFAMAEISKTKDPGQNIGTLLQTIQGKLGRGSNPR